MKYIRIIGMSILMIVFISSSSLFANEDLGNIDKNESYDIYYGSAGVSESFVVKRVRIIRVDRINDLEFLVFINDSGFNAKSKEGFILFSSIKAIVPNSTFIIRGSEQNKQY